MSTLEETILQQISRGESLTLEYKSEFYHKALLEPFEKRPTQSDQIIKTGERKHAVYTRNA